MYVYAIKCVWSLSAGNMVINQIMYSNILSTSFYHCSKSIQTHHTFNLSFIIITMEEKHLHCHQPAQSSSRRMYCTVPYFAHLQMSFMRIFLRYAEELRSKRRLNLIDLEKSLRQHQPAKAFQLCKSMWAGYSDLSQLEMDTIK